MLETLLEKGKQAFVMKFSFWSGWNKHSKVETSAVIATVTPSQNLSSFWRVAPPPAPVPVNPATRAMETALALLATRVAETLASAGSCRPAFGSRHVDLADDSRTLCEATDRKARELPHRADVKHAERYVAQTAEIIAALHAAERAASLLGFLCADSANAALVPIIRPAADSCERVIRHCAKVLESPAADVFTWSNSVVSGQNETQTAVYKAMVLLNKESVTLTPSARKIARAALWTMEVAAEVTAHAALECRGVVLPSPATSRVLTQHEPSRYTSDLRHSHYAPV